MKNIKKLKIREDASIKQALKVIAKGNIKIAIVVSNRGKFIGILSDGDIRRGFLKGLNINSSIKFLFNRKPIIGKKGDSREKLLKIAFSKKIYEIPLVDSKGRLEKIFTINEHLNDKAFKNKVIIMAGGRGMRLRPLTKNIPKPMLKIGGQPIIERTIERFRNFGFKDFILCVNYKSHVIKNHFKTGDRFGVSIEYIEEKKRMGTAGALSLIKEKIKLPFFVINGDLLTDIDYKKMLDFHVKNKTAVTMGVKKHSIPSPYGEVKLNRNKIVAINEKPTYQFFANIGIYILNPECIKLIPNKFYDMPTLFKKIISKKFKIISFLLNKNWLDIGKIENYKWALMKFKKFN
jgi:dTDP-glucose pyrophosphorylase